MVIPHEQLAVAGQLLLQQIAQNLSFVQSNPEAVALAIFQSLHHQPSEELTSAAHIGAVNLTEWESHTRSPFLRGLAHQDASEESHTEADYLLNGMLSFVCVVCAAFASGLTQGLLSLDFTEMTIKSASGTAEEKEYAAKLLPIITNHHLLLVTLMLWNATAMEALPIFLDKMMPEFVAIIVSVTLVLIMGEIIPAAILTGPNQLKLAARLVPLVYVVMFVLFPIAYPIAKVLDFIIGTDEGPTVYSRRELKTMMHLQHEEVMRRSIAHSKDVPHDPMHQDEVAIIGGALTFRDTMVSEVMTHEENVFMISIEEKLSYKIMYEIFKSGYSRIPVFDKDRNDVAGLILAKDLLFIDPDDETPVRNFVNLFGRKPMVVWHDQKLGETLTMFRNERAHLAIVRDVETQGSGDPYYKVVGIITLEDIIEEILGTEIEDETEVPTDPHFLIDKRLFFHGRVDIDALEGNSAGASTRTQNLRDLDYARLRIHQEKLSSNVLLSEEEIKSAINCIQVNHPEIENVICENVQALKPVSSSDSLEDRAGLLREYLKTQADVISMHRKTPPITSPVSPPPATARESSPLIVVGDEEEGTEKLKGHASQVDPSRKISHDDLLYRRGKISNSCILILEGYVKVFTGSEEKESLRGPWSILGAEALLLPEGTYHPDFSAFVDSDTLRFVRLSTFTSPTSQSSGWSHLGKGKGKGNGRGKRRSSAQDALLGESSPTIGHGVKTLLPSFDGKSRQRKEEKSTLTSLIFGGDTVNHSLEKIVQRISPEPETFNPIVHKDKEKFKKNPPPALKKPSATKPSAAAPMPVPVAMAPSPPPSSPAPSTAAAYVPVPASPPQDAKKSLSPQEELVLVAMDDPTESLVDPTL